MSFAIKDLVALQQFEFDRLLSDDPVTRSLVILGTFPKTQGDTQRLPAILRIERAALDPRSASIYCQALLDRVQLVESNDIYYWLLGWFNDCRDKDVKINIISPATDIHIRKYSMQERVLVRESPELYNRIVKPYIEAFPQSRTQWVDDILSGKTEAHKVLYNDPSPTSGFIIIPDMKWDLSTLSSLYLIAITRSKDIKCLRDLRKGHLCMLRSIRREATRVVKERWGLCAGMARLFIHYQPSYYHFHVHIVNTRQDGLAGMTVGQAHLLDDVISLLEVDSDETRPLFERMSLTYMLGDQHGLFGAMMAAQAELPDDE